ncbi:MAG: FecR domain-containing protein [Planctomycetaceae bacterium]
MKNTTLKGALLCGMAAMIGAAGAVADEPAPTNKNAAAGKPARDQARVQLAILLDSDPDAARRFVEEMTLSANLGSVMQASRLTPLPNHHGRRSFGQRAVPILLLVFLAFALIPGTDLFFSSETEVIGTIAGSGGSLVWTAGNGQLVDLPGQGGGVTGGTIEGLSPDAWFCLEFRDGSRVTVSGISVLTVSDEGQKRLRLREGRISVSATQQPDKRPMLVWTRSAELQVLGTQFDVISDANQTSLSVSEGQVRLRRRSDRQELVVPAMHRVVVDPVLPLELQQPGTVRFWESDVAAGPGCLSRARPRRRAHHARP